MKDLHEIYVERQVKVDGRTFKRDFIVKTAKAKGFVGFYYTSGLLKTETLFMEVSVFNSTFMKITETQKRVLEYFYRYPNIRYAPSEIQWQLFVVKPNRGGWRNSESLGALRFLVNHGYIRKYRGGRAFYEYVYIKDE